MKLLYVGDPHATPDALDEMERLVDLIRHTAKEHNVYGIVFLGDQYHTHSIVNLSVMAFWDKAFKSLPSINDGRMLLALVGNHDKPGIKGATENAMMLHEEVDVVSKPFVNADILWVPYVHDPAEFVAICRAHPNVKTVVCHQTFSGSVFENGFTVPDGVEPDDIPQEFIISGHIHKPQRVGKVWYPGSPRWRTVSDANTERAIWVVEHGNDGSILSTTPIDTSKHCTPIYSLVDAPDNQLDFEKLPAGKVIVDLYGPHEYINSRRTLFEGFGYRVRTFPETEKVVKVKESDGLPTALKKFLGEYTPKNGTSPEEIWKMATERISWLKNA